MLTDNIRFKALLTWFALPVYLWQGIGVRRKSVRMAPPKAPALTDVAGEGKPVTMLVLGDSSAAGVGVEKFSESVAGRLPGLLADKTGRPVTMRVAGNNSATSGQIRDHVVPNIKRMPFDYIVLNIGINDSKNFHSGPRFKREFGTLLYALRTRFPDAEVIWSGMIDLQSIPALPYPLNKILGIRSRLLRTIGQALCRERGAHAPKSNWQPVVENFSSDGFHASSKGYKEWAEEVAEFIAELEKQKSAPR